jgi:hypothetical protein
MNASSSRPPSTSPSPACALMYRPLDTSQTAHQTCRKPRISTTCLQRKQTTACPRYRMYSLNRSVHPVTTTTTAQATLRIPISSRRSRRRVSRPSTSNLRTRLASASSALPKKLYGLCLEDVRICCRVWSIMAATSPRPHPRQCRNRTRHRLTHRQARRRIAPPAQEDVAVTSMNATTAPHRLDARVLVLDRLVRPETAQRRKNRRRRNSLPSARALGICSIHDHM